MAGATPAAVRRRTLPSLPALLLFAIPVFVWMKWRRRHETSSEEWALWRSDEEASVPIGLGLE
jgi:hypothetical protein